MRVSLSFEVHQPFRINRNFKAEYSKKKRNLFDVYFNNSWNRDVFRKVAEKCYFPATQIIIERIDDLKEFKVSYSFSGVLIEQCEMWEPDLLELFKELASKKNVELLCQTYYHSLAGLFRKKDEFIEQIEMHRSLMKDIFKKNPSVFENTEFLYNNSIAKIAERLGFKAIFTEGADRILGWRSPNYVYRAKNSNIKVLLRNYRLSDDIAFRFSNREWNEYPLTADKFATWLAYTPGDCVNLFMDYETFGEHHWKETGILEFLKWLPGEIIARGIEFALPSDLAHREPVDEIDVGDFDTLSWADVERDTSAWLGNDMQRTSFRALERLEGVVKKTEKEYVKLWRYLQISDNLYYMYSKEGPSGIVHGYFSQQYPFEVYSAYTRILSDLYVKCSMKLKEPHKSAAYSLRVLPPEDAFHYYQNGNYTGLSAHSLEEFAETLNMLDNGSFKFHMSGGDFIKWIKYEICDNILSEMFNNIEKKKECVSAVKRRCEELWKLFE